MGCSGSKHGMVATGSTVTCRRLARARFASSSTTTVKAPGAAPTGVPRRVVDPAAAAASAVPEIKGTTVSTDVSAAAGEEEATGNPVAERPKMMNTAPSSKLRDLGDVGTCKPDAQDDEMPCAPVDDLRRQLQQLAEKLARLSAEDDGGDDDSDSEEDAKCVEVPLFEEEEEEEEVLFGDAAAQEFDADQEFKEDFSNKLPVYDEDPYDLIQIPGTVDGDHSVCHLSLVAGEIGDEQTIRILCQRFARARQPKLYGSARKKEMNHYHQLRYRQIRKRTKRRTYYKV